MSLSDHLKKRGVKKLPTTKCPVKLRPEVLLHQNIPQPLHQVNPRSVLGKKWWDQERKKAYESTNFHCIACGVHKTLAKARQWLEGHELYDIDYLKGRAKYVETVPLCHYCHNSIHSGRLQALLDSGYLHHQKYVAIIQHRDQILKAAGLTLPAPYTGKVAEWSKWRLRIGRNLYPPKFKNIEEWEKAHAK